MWEMMGAEASTGIALTESLAMTPAASVCGLYFAHPEAKYFAVGKVARDQVRERSKKSVPRRDCFWICLTWDSRVFLSICWTATFSPMKINYRVGLVVWQWVGLTSIWNVPPSCLGSR